jgi:hypothetical protein
MQRTYGWGLIVVTSVLALSLVLLRQSSQTPKALEANEAASFLKRHWQMPIPLQGEPPTAYSPLEASLYPKDCGACHSQQYQDWQSSLHSQSMSPGVYGQLLDMEPATVTLCATCHTPLSEQIPYLEQNGDYRKNPAFDARLQQAGLACAACHVRQHQHFGPPRRLELPPLPAEPALPHGGFTASVAYQQSAFCKGCHQFEADDFALNGKLIENTYEEWRLSSYATDGIQCQHCHMPDRRHTWRGIHDPDMVKQALTVSVEPDAASYLSGDQLQAVITIANTGAGHYLPTYVTPKITVQAHLLDARGKAIADTGQQVMIGREVTLNLSEELYDTRIPPNASRAFTYAQQVPDAAVTLRVRVVVHPDHFYQRFFEAVLANDNIGQGRAHLEEALRRTRASSFTVFEQELPLRRD